MNSIENRDDLSDTRKYLSPPILRVSRRLETDIDSKKSGGLDSALKRNKKANFHYPNVYCVRLNEQNNKKKRQRVDATIVSVCAVRFWSLQRKFYLFIVCVCALNLRFQTFFSIFITHVHFIQSNTFEESLKIPTQQQVHATFTEFFFNHEFHQVFLNKRRK